jgi:hypothetical protein
LIDAGPVVAIVVGDDGTRGALAEAYRGDQQVTGGDVAGVLNGGGSAAAVKDGGLD